MVPRLLDAGCDLLNQKTAERISNPADFLDMDLVSENGELERSAPQLGARHGPIGHDREIRHPWSDFFEILLGHDPRHLGNVSEVMDDPGCQELP